MLKIPNGLAPISSLIATGDESVRLCVEYERSERYSVPLAIVAEKDLLKASPELRHQFINPRSVSPPGRSLTYLRDCIVLPNAAIITAGGAIIRESCFPYADKKRVLTMFHPWILEEGGELFAAVDNPEVAPRPAVYLREHGEMGFFHWMHSVFPRIDVIHSQFIPQEYGLLIQSRAGYQQASLALVDTCGHETIAPSSSRPQFFKELLFPSTLVEDGDFWLRPPSVRRFYQSLPVGKGPGHKRLYVTRQDAAVRRLKNESELLQLLREMGFVAVELGRITFDEQLALFRDAEVVVGVHGAGLSHIVSMSPATGVLEILHPRRFWATYRALAARVNLHYAFAVGEDPGPDVTGDGFDFEIDRDKLKSVLDRLVMAVGR